jgi:hypothetical protein
MGFGLRVKFPARKSKPRNWKREKQWTDRRKVWTTGLAAHGNDNDQRPWESKGNNCSLTESFGEHYGKDMLIE